MFGGRKTYRRKASHCGGKKTHRRNRKGGQYSYNESAALSAMVETTANNTR